LSAFQYRTGGSLLHGLDPRTKLAAAAVFALIGMAASLPVLAVSGISIVWALWRAGVGPRHWVRDLRIFWMMLLFLFAVRAVTGSGPALVQIGSLKVTAQGLAEGGMICLRLWIVALAGIGVSAATRPSEIEAAVQALLRPVPFVPEKRVATILGLVVRFLPEVLREVRLTKEAQMARCVEQRKNPITRLYLFAVPLLRRIFARADRLAMAMEARCYSDNRTGPVLSAGPADGLTAAALGALLLLLLL